MKKLFSQFKKKIFQAEKNIKDIFVKFFRKKNNIDENFFNRIEEQLLTLDIGTSISKLIVDKIKENIGIQDLNDINVIRNIIEKTMYNILKKCKENSFIRKSDFPKIILLFGINGVGKTISSVKLAKMYINKGKKSAIVCADTFRAASIEQMKTLTNQHKISAFFSDGKKDAASIIFDSVKLFKNKKTIQYLIIDTAGRLENNINLIEELKKIVRVIEKFYYQNLYEKILVIDSTIGQSSFNQTKVFYDSIKPTGIFLTKLDGTAKGGSIFSIINNFKIPIKYVGFGESINDISKFNQKKFIKYLFKHHG